MHSTVIIDNRSVCPPSDAFAVDIDSNATEVFRNTTDQAYGYANAWTWAVWTKIAVFSEFSGTEKIFETIDAGLAGDNNIFLETNEAGDVMTVFIRDPSANAKKWDFAGLPSVNVWHLYAVTWDGTDIRLYIDGSEVSVTAKPTDGSPTMLNGDRILNLPGRFDGAGGQSGIYHSAAVWDSVLNDSNQTGLYALGCEIDWLSDAGTYTSSADIQHYWRLGLDSTDSEIGKDYKGTINISDNATNITSADVVTDSPKG